MKLSRILIASVVGGLLMFIWGAVAHMVLPLGEWGTKMLPVPNGQMIVSAMNISLKERGFYRFPPMDEAAWKKMSKDEQTKAFDEYSKTYEAGPRGIIIYDPQPGVIPMGPQMLGIEFGSNVAAAFFLACIIGMAGGGAGRGAVIGAAAGLFAALSISVSYWNWDRFPTDFTMSEHAQQLIGGLITGLAIGLVLGRPKPAPVTV